MGGVGQVKEEFDGVISSTTTVGGDVGVIDQLDLSNSNPAAVAIVDENGDQITSFGGGTQYTEDAAAAANPVGTAVSLVRQDTPAALTTTDGDNVAQRGTNYGAGFVQVVTSGGAFVDTFGGGTQYAEGDTDASITGTAMMMEGAADTLVPAQGTVADGMLVNLGANNDVTVAGVSTSAKQDTIIGHLDGVEGLLTTIDADTSALAGAVSGTEVQVDVLTMPTVTVTATNLDIRDLTSASDSVAAVQSGTWTEANSAAIAASLSVLDDWDETNRAAVNLIAGQAGIAGGTGVDGATVPRVTLATDVGLPAGTAAIGKVGHDITGIGHGVTTVTTAGTDVALAASTACKRVVIQAQTDNTGLIAVGATGVDATVATGTGVLLSPGDFFELEIDNLADVFIDSTVNGEGVRYTYFT